MIRKTRLAARLSLLLLLGACAATPSITPEPTLSAPTPTRSALMDLPPPRQKLDVAVYSFEDVTGQFKPSEGFQSLSKAVSQGGDAILIKALGDAGNRSWFTVVERAKLNQLLQERKIIQDMRARYLGEETVDARALPPMRFAGLIFAGGIVGYDSNTRTGGAGARLLGIGGKAEYRENTISVNLRVISVKTGEVLASVIAQKRVISTGISGGSFSYIDFDKILEIEAGFSSNEPGFIALTRAVEKAVHALILEGVDRGIWFFEDQSSAASTTSALPAIDMADS